jgi:16S rRNA (adenine1518-N6/adenine1519-N6)-dimethyltransferase
MPRLDRTGAPPSRGPSPRKALGQHFLVDPNIVRKILVAAEVRPDETVLEIGPGLGALTRPLCEAAMRVIAVEIDDRLVAHLQQTLHDCPNLDLRHGDALNVGWGDLPDRTVLVANLPYYISSPLLFAALEQHRRWNRMVVMLQREVARRLVAPPGTREYGILSVLARYRTDARSLFHVSPDCFRPRPDVGSTVVRFLSRERPAADVADETLFVRVVRAAFAHRRKTLLNSLRDEGFSRDIVADLAEAGIEPSRRAETLALEEFARLADAMHRRRATGRGP